MASRDVSAGSRRAGLNAAAWRGVLLRGRHEKGPRLPKEPEPRTVCGSGVGLPPFGVPRRHVCRGGPYEDATSAEPLP